jgi:hypothetical protein
MTEVKIPVPEIEVPAAAMEMPAVTAFQRFLTGAGEMSPQEAEGFTRALLAAILVDVGQWAARVTVRNLKAVLRLQVELKLRYAGALELLLANRELPADLQPEAFREIYLELARRVDAVVPFDELIPEDPDAAIDAVYERLGSRPQEVPIEEAGAELEGVDTDEPYRPPEERPGEYFDDPEQLLMEEQWAEHDDDADLVASQRTLDPLLSFNRDLTRVLERFGDLPPSRRVGAASAATRAAAENFGAALVRQFLSPAGIDIFQVHRQPVLGPHMAAEGALGIFDPVRELGYEIAFRAPADYARGGRLPPLIKPDGWAILGADSFLFLEHKGHENIPAEGFFGGSSGDSLLYDLELRGRLAQRIPACRGWRYSADLPELTEVFDWTVRTLQGEHPATVPDGASADFAQAVGVLAADPTTADWAAMLQVAP